MTRTPGSLPPRPWGLPDVAAVALVTGLGGLLRFSNLADPRALMFDEVYYARDACWYAFASASLCGVDGERTLVHPPLGKQLIAAGIELFGYDPFGRRVAAAVAGTLMVGVLYVLARKVLASTLAAALSAGLLAVDFLALVQSRIAMLDVFAALFGLVAVTFAAFDRDGILARRRSAGPHPHPLRRPWRLAAGAAGGAATASKWSGALFVVTVLVLVLAWELGARGGRGRRLVRSEGPSVLLYLCVVPVVVYAASYAGHLDGALLAAPWAQGGWLRALWDRQAYMYSFHAGLEVTHAYQSPPWSWLLLKRPVSYYFETDASGDYMEVLATGSPLVWWASLAALAYVAARGVRRRDPAGTETLIVTSFCLTYLPWLLLAGDRSAVFLFYALPAVPFMCLALGYVAARLEPLPAGRAAIAVFCALTLAVFAFYYPLLANRPLPRAAWLDRIWVFDDCAKPSGAGRVPARDGTATTSGTDGDLPPSGWCWI